VLRARPTESVYLLLADIEEAETGDQGKVRQWLARAVKAPRDPAWTADGYVSERWSPVSPVTGRLNSFEWKVPVVELAPVVEAEEPEIKGPIPDDKAPVPVVVTPPVREAPVKSAPQIDVVEAAPPAPAQKRDEIPQPPLDASPIDDADDEDKRGHFVVDDPGVDQNSTPRKAQGGLRLF
jgi:HemY protein